MSGKRLVLGAVVILAFWACDLQAAQIASTWVGGAQGEWGAAGEWGDASNWDPAIVPDNNATNTFAVTIDAAVVGELVQVNLQRNRTIDKLDCDGEVWMYMGVDDTAMPVELTLIEPGGLTNYGEFQLWIYAAHWSRVVGNITNHGEMELRGNVGYIKGNVTNLSGAELFLMDLWVTGNLDNSAGGMIMIESVVDVGGTVENAGSIEVIPAGELLVDNTLHNMGQIQMYGGFCGGEGLFHNDVNGVIKGFGVLYAEGLLQNQGQIIASGGSLTVISEGSVTNTGTLANKALSTLHIQPGDDVNNQGTIEVNTGGGVAFDSNLVNQANGIIKLPGGTLAATTITQTADASFAGFGSIAGDVAIAPNGTTRLTGPTNIVGDVNIPAGAALEISDGQTLITGHTVCDGTIHLIGGTVIFQGGCDCDDCNIINDAGTDRNHFDLNADGIADFKDLAYFAQSWLWQASWY